MTEAGERLTPGGYRPRVVEAELGAALAASPAVVVEGPRACGKTWTGRRFARSEVPFDSVANYQLAAQVDPAGTLVGATPRLLDEWQLAPQIWNAMRRACDDRGLKGQFILTGSANPPDDVTRHTGTGRVIRVRMRPMSLFESGESNGAVSLGGLLEGERVLAPEAAPELAETVALTCRGGWPLLLGDAPQVAQTQLRAYLDETSRTDVTRVDDAARDPRGIGRLLRSLARNSSTEVSYKTLGTDAGGNGETLHPQTVKSYLAALERLFVAEELAAWRPRLQSRAELRTTPKRYFVDPSLAVAALRSNAQQLMGDLAFYGQLFESLVVRDLRVYAQANDCELSFYRDSTGLEVDVIVRSRSEDRWMAFEVKLGGTALVEAGADSLRRLRSSVDVDTMGEPAKLAVITATGTAYEFPDGIAVIPLSTLGP